MHKFRSEFILKIDHQFLTVNEQFELEKYIAEDLKLMIKMCFLQLGNTKRFNNLSVKLVK